MLNIFVQFLLEALRAILIEALSGHVRKHVLRILVRRSAPSCPRRAPKNRP